MRDHGFRHLRKRGLVAFVDSESNFKIVKNLEQNMKMVKVQRQKFSPNCWMTRQFLCNFLD